MHLSIGLQNDKISLRGLISKTSEMRTGTKFAAWGMIRLTKKQLTAVHNGGFTQQMWGQLVPIHYHKSIIIHFTFYIFVNVS